MHQDTGSKCAESIKRSLRGISVGSYVFQSEVAARLGLNRTDLEAIYRVGSAPDGLSAGELARQLGLTSGATTTVIDRLVAAGYLQRRRDERDRRRVTVRLDRDGARRLGKQYAEVDRRIDDAIGTLSRAERATVARFLERVARS